jgi:hypothetical protein
MAAILLFVFALELKKSGVNGLTPLLRGASLLSTPPTASGSAG